MVWAGLALSAALWVALFAVASRDSSSLGRGKVASDERHVVAFPADDPDTRGQGTNTLEQHPTATPALLSTVRGIDDGVRTDSSSSRRAQTRPTVTPTGAGALVSSSPRPLTKECIEVSKAANGAIAANTRRSFDLTHVINPFATTDVHFLFTLKSISAAVQHARRNNVSVQVLGITFDNEVIKLPDEVRVLHSHNRWYSLS